MGLTGLESWDEFIAANERNYQQYREELADVPGLSLVTYDEAEACNFQYVTVEVDEGEAGLSRDELVALLHAENVIARRYFYPGCHRMEPYRSYFPHAGLLLPHTERLVARVMCLPTGTAVGEEEVRAVCGLVRLAVENSADVRRRLRERAAPPAALVGAAALDPEE
jgi:dTDP-4-amino-4,6-dideoxygalactose transaminase